MRPSRAVPVAAVVILLLAVAAIIASSRPHGPGPGEAEVTLTGRASVTRSSGARETVTDRVFLRRGDSITVLAGQADFELADDVRFQALHEAGSRDPHVVMGTTPRLAAGDLLVTTAATTEDALRLQASGTEVTIGGSGRGSAVRLSQTYAVTVSVYRGRALVDSAGAGAGVARLRRVEVPAPGRVGRSLPIDLDPEDRWDRRFLGSAIAIDRQLAPVLAAWTRSGGGGWTVAQLQGALPGQPSEAELEALVTPSRAGGETMVGAAIAGLGTRGTFADRWQRVFAFHDQGASWGLVAMDQDVAAMELISAVSAPINGTPFPFPDVALAATTTPAVTGIVANAAAAPAGAATTPAGPATGATTSPTGVRTAGTTPGTTGAGTTNPTGGGSAGGGSAPGGGGTTGGSIGGNPITGGGSIIGGGGTPVTTPTVTTPPITTPTVTPPPIVVVPPISTPTVTTPPIVVLPPISTPPVTLPPVTVPPIRVPPVTIPSVTVPPVVLPQVTVPSVSVPPIVVPQVVLPQVALPPVVVPPVALPPVTGLLGA